jgi:hypothetical protein
MRNLAEESTQGNAVSWVVSWAIDSSRLKVEKKYSDGTIVVSHSSHQTMNLNNVSYYRCELSNEESEPVLPALSHLEQLV